MIRKRVMPPKSWTIGDLLRVTTDYLKTKGIESPRLTSDILLAHQLKTERMTLYLNLDQPLTKREIAGYRSLIKRRLRREPVQYITGVQEFWSLSFEVNPSVLIPRPETELLVERTLEMLKRFAAGENRNPRILDLGTGSGAIAVSLAKALPKAHIDATDISAAALQVAHANAERHGVSDRIRFLQGDLWDAFRGRCMAFDVVLSNPPYIPAEDYQDLSPEIREYEPRVALDGHEGGLRFIERILSEAPAYIRSGGWILLEMAPYQTNRALALMGSIRAYGEKRRIRDYSHQYRAVTAQRI